MDQHPSNSLPSPSWHNDMPTTLRETSVEITAYISQTMATILNFGLGLKELLAEIAETTRTRFGVENVGIYLFDASQNLLKLETWAGPTQEASIEAVALDDDTLVAQVARTGLILFAQNAGSGMKSFVASPPCAPCNELALPMLVLGELKGVLTLRLAAPNTLLDPDLGTLAVLAEQSAMAIENIRLFETGREAQHESELLYKISRSINTAMSAVQILTAIVRETGVLPFALQLSVYERYNLSAATYSQTIATVPAGSREAVPEDAIHPILELGRNEVGIFVCEDTGILPAPDHEYFLDRSIRAIANARMSVSQRIIGSISFTSPTPRQFSPIECRLIQGISDLAAAAVERSRLYDEQVQVAERLRSLDELKSRFLASMSHELRTPLNAILNYTDFILLGLMGPITTDQQSCLEKVLMSGKHLLALINDVLDMSKIEAGMMTLFLEQNVNFHEDLDQVISTAEILLKDRPVVFVKAIDADLPPITCDRRRVRQVLLNLISNAAKFTETGSVTLKAHHDGNEILFAVIDTGPGIASEDQESIFEPFKQTIDGLKQGSGTGLGLAISKRFIEAHRGSLWLDSERGKGSAFYFRLPIQVTA
jgi:signal transduction histidine kinase/putative methionine-R-sulfoxide reductase with GAF domain